MNINPLEAYIEIIHRDKDGNILDHIDRPSHSWVKNFYNLVITSCYFDAFSYNRCVLKHRYYMFPNSNELIF